MCTVGIQQSRRDQLEVTFYFIFIANEGIRFILYLCMTACAIVMCGG